MFEFTRQDWYQAGVKRKLQRRFEIQEWSWTRKDQDDECYKFRWVWILLVNESGSSGAFGTCWIEVVWVSMDCESHCMSLTYIELSLCPPEFLFTSRDHKEFRWVKVSPLFCWLWMLSTTDHCWCCLVSPSSLCLSSLPKSCMTRDQDSFSLTNCSCRVYCTHCVGELQDLVKLFICLVESRDYSSLLLTSPVVWHLLSRGVLSFFICLTGS